MGSVPVLVRVEEDTYKVLEELRKRKGRLSVQELIREAISEYLEREKPVLEV